MVSILASAGARKPLALCIDRDLPDRLDALISLTSNHETAYLRLMNVRAQKNGFIVSGPGIAVCRRRSPALRHCFLAETTSEPTNTDIYIRVLQSESYWWDDILERPSVVSLLTA
jgi:hypothetical protein